MAGLTQGGRDVPSVCQSRAVVARIVLSRPRCCIAVFALFIVPIVLVVLWMVHGLPEKIAHKRHHP
jgi:hypothetical protein